MMRCSSAICLLLCLLSLTGCHKSREYFPKNLPAEEMYIVRFDEVLLNMDTAFMQTNVQYLYDDFSDFMPTFCEDILGIDVSDTTFLIEALPKFLYDTVYGFKQTNERTKQVFRDISPIQKELETAFTRIHYLYPEKVIPQIWFIISGFNASILFMPQLSEPPREDILVGVDMYLGSDWEYYNQVVYNYQKQTMRPECIPADVVSAWLFRNIPYTSQKNHLLDNMIYRGKIMYLLSLLLPDETEAEVMGYTEEQWKWAKHNEAAVWKLILDKQDLFATDSPILTSYLNDGPFTAEISQESPARLGTYIGWQIAKSYMQHNPQVSLQMLMADGDAQKILEESYYRP